MFERTIEDINKAIEYCKSLVNSRIYNPKALTENAIPTDIGVYVWRLRKDNSIVYVGRGMSKNGLHQRIIRQHLSKSYEGVLKKQIKAEFTFHGNEEAVQYIRDNFTFSFVPFGISDKSLVNLVETLMIHEFQPKYNRSGKYDEDKKTPRI